MILNSFEQSLILFFYWYFDMYLLPIPLFDLILKYNNLLTFSQKQAFNLIVITIVILCWCWSLFVSNKVFVAFCIRNFGLTFDFTFYFCHSYCFSLHCVAFRCLFQRFKLGWSIWGVYNSYFNSSCIYLFDWFICGFGVYLHLPILFHC